MTNRVRGGRAPILSPRSLNMKLCIRTIAKDDCSKAARFNHHLSQTVTFETISFIYFPSNRGISPQATDWETKSKGPLKTNGLPGRARLSTSVVVGVRRRRPPSHQRRLHTSTEHTIPITTSITTSIAISLPTAADITAAILWRKRSGFQSSPRPFKQRQHHQ